MTNEAVVSVFELSNDRGHFCPKLNIEYQEKNTGGTWQINAGGTRCYTAHTAGPLEQDLDEAAASHFMVSRIVGALLMSGCGLFTPFAKGRIRFGSPDTFSWRASLNLELYSEDVKRAHSGFSQEIFRAGWMLFPNTLSCDVP